MHHEPHAPTPGQLRAWARDLAEREEALAAAQDDFELRVSRFERNAEQFVELRSGDLWEALRVVRRAFPCGLVIEPWGPRPDATIH